MYGLADYIADNYGECVRGPACYHAQDGCRHPGNSWLGRQCPHWRPVKAKDWEELRAEAAREPNQEPTKDDRQKDSQDPHRLDEGGTGFPGPQ